MSIIKKNHYRSSRHRTCSYAIPGRYCAYIKCREQYQIETVHWNNVSYILKKYITAGLRQAVRAVYDFKLPIPWFKNI